MVTTEVEDADTTAVGDVAITADTTEVDIAVDTTEVVIADIEVSLDSSFNPRTLLLWLSLPLFPLLSPLASLLSLRASRLTPTCSHLTSPHFQP